VGIPGDEKADSAAREALDEYLDRTEEYLLQDLVNWITAENQQTHWEQNGSEIKNQKPQRTKRNNTSEIERRHQVVISRFQTNYTRATHSYIINYEPPPECPFWNTNLATDHILWT
jgi:hypothetical protein